MLVWKCVSKHHVKITYALMETKLHTFKHIMLNVLGY